MPLYEFVFRVSGRPDEVRISDYNGLGEGDEVSIGGRPWTVLAKERATAERRDGLPVEERIILMRAWNRSPSRSPLR